MMRILVVDDDKMFRQLLQEELSCTGHTVLEAEDGEQALAILHEETIQLVITDWIMPRMDGLELVRRIRSANLPRYTYIILLTARTSQEDVVTGLEVGADDYLTKPFDMQELQARVAIGGRILALEARLRKALSRMRVMATYDSLTGLLNRQSISRYAEIELARAKRMGRPLSIILLDIDHFKMVNDRHGHLVGDEALRHVSEVIRHIIRPYDRAGRWGGEEFLLLLPETDLQQAMAVAERVRERVADTLVPLSAPSEQKEVSLSVSIGVTELEVDTMSSLTELLQQADRALYRAKNEGRDRVRSLT